MREIPERLQALRARMAERRLSHYLVPSSDEHLNEYVPVWRQRRAWLSGFTGSAGELLVGAREEETWLFTDGRYHLQAETELQGTGIGLQKVGNPEAKTLVEVLRALAGGDGCAVGYDPMLLPVGAVAECTRALEEGGARLVPVSPNLVDGLWADRVEPPTTPLRPVPAEWCDQGMEAKWAKLRDALAERNADATVVVKLDQIAWFTNLRSLADIEYNPVFEAFLYADAETVHLFLRGAETRLPPGWEVPPWLRVRAYEEFPEFLAQLGPARVLVDPERTTRGVLDTLDANPTVRLIRAPSPLEKAKAIKSPAELDGMARANLHASVAKTRALLWLERQLTVGRTVTEREFATTLERYYAQSPGYWQLSFPTIAATGEHGAVVHYGSVDDTPLRTGELFLVDSGIQADGGTTDDTRTVAVGPPTDEQRRVYTLVLKAHIAVARQVFPEGTPGAALDALARAPLWQEQLVYSHGTGHGVGALLNVHEGPFSLSEARRKSQPSYGLKAGMITSVEPGYYRSGFGGIRLESLYRVVEDEKDTDGRTWLRLESLTWVPFEGSLIDLALLGPEDREWLERYHEGCLERLAAHLSDAELSRLHERLSTPA